jgi:hypothetical protein
MRLPEAKLSLARFGGQVDYAASLFMVAYLLSHSGWS